MSEDDTNLTKSIKAKIWEIWWLSSWICALTLALATYIEDSVNAALVADHLAQEGVEFIDCNSTSLVVT